MTTENGKKSRFGKYAVLDNTRYVFTKESDFWWDIRPVTAGDELAMSKFMVVNRTVRQPDGTERDLPPVWMEIAFREIALSFAGTNIPADPDKKVEEGGDPFIRVGESPESIEAKLRQMPNDMINELWKAVGEANPLWGPPKPRQVSTETNSSQS